MVLGSRIDVSGSIKKNHTSLWWYFDWSEFALLGFKGRTGLDLTEGKSGLVFVPIRPCLPADYQVVSCCDFGFFELTLDQECQCCVTDTTVISSRPEYTSVWRSTFPFGNSGWNLLPTGCACFAASLCISWNYFKWVTSEDHYVKRSVLIAEPLWA